MELDAIITDLSNDAETLKNKMDLKNKEKIIEELRNK